MYRPLDVPLVGRFGDLVGDFAVPLRFLGGTGEDVKLQQRPVHSREQRAIPQLLGETSRFGELLEGGARFAETLQATAAAQADARDDIGVSTALRRLERRVALRERVLV